MYAILGDIHSSKEDLEKVYKSIQAGAADASIIGTGDLFECTISKKDITDKKFTELAHVLLNPSGFEELLTFPSVRGNQEERIVMITQTEEILREKLVNLPETIDIEGAKVIHGHQWRWGGHPWSLQQADIEARLTFFGHSHRSALSIDGKWQKVDWSVPYDVSCGEILVNVGAVVGDCEWVLYDPEKQTVTFKKA